MRKALLINLEEKKNKQLVSAASISPNDRLDYLFQLIRLSKNFKKSKGKISNPWAVNNFTLSRKA